MGSPVASDPDVERELLVGGAVPQYRVLVSGSLGFDDFRLLCDTLDRVLAGKEHVAIITGGAKGAESLGERYAEERGFAAKRLLADWALYGRGAKVIRNTQMVEEADCAEFFWDGKSKAVAELIEKAETKGIPVEVVRSAPRGD